MSIILILILTKGNFEKIISAYLLSFSISIVLNYISTIPVSIIFSFFVSDEMINAAINFNEPIYLLGYFIIFIVQILLSVLLFRIKRLKKGFPFIFNRYTIVVSLIIIGMILVFTTGVNMLNGLEEKRTEANILTTLFIVGVIIIGFGVYILIRRLIKNYQRRRAQQNTESLYEKMYYKEKEKNEQLSKQIIETEKAKSSALHNIEDRLKSMEDAARQGRVMQDDVDNLQNDWQKELDKFKGKKLLSSTKISSMDNLFEYYAKKLTDDNIIFNLLLDGSIKYMLDNVIEKGDLETLIVNHINDAQIAINASNNTYRRITAMLRLKNDYYEFCVYDSGIPFSTDTLMRLGTGRVTTNADKGGSGIGFETTFEIMKKYNASLIINEQEQSNIDYSKSISIRFDGKNQYIIETYRPNDFLESERYIIADKEFK